LPAALLHNNKKPNDLKDNQESSLHVLTWMASRFTKHTISEGKLNRFLRAFNEAYEAGDGVRGDLKMGIHEMPRKVKFDHCPHLDTLIKELTQRLVACFEEPPSAKDF
jgi:hypothetical protein